MLLLLGSRVRHDCILQTGRLRIAEGQQALLARLTRLVETTALVSMPSVASLSVASHVCVCEQVIKALTRSTSSEKAAPGEPPWALDMLLIGVSQVPIPERGR